jgi:hypothetical protein
MRVYEKQASGRLVLLGVVPSSAPRDFALPRHDTWFVAAFAGLPTLALLDLPPLATRSFALCCHQNVASS